MNIDEIVENFQYLEDWEDRYKYLIELGNGLEDFPEDKRNADTKVNGCVSQVWITSEQNGELDPVMTFRGDSDAHIVRGLVAISLAIFSEKKASKITKSSPCISITAANLWHSACHITQG